MIIVVYRLCVGFFLVFLFGLLAMLTGSLFAVLGFGVLVWLLLPAVELVFANDYVLGLDCCLLVCDVSYCCLLIALVVVLVVVLVGGWLLLGLCLWFMGGLGEFGSFGNWFAVSCCAGCV